MNKFELAKKSFSDSEDRFIELPSAVSINYEKLKRVLEDKNIPITLVYGESGSGKSTLIQNAFKDLNSTKHTLLFNNRFLNKDTFIEQIYEFLKIEKPKKLQDAMEGLFNIEERINIILDEANLYTQDELEFIRELSNTKLLKFIVVMYDNNLLKKSYFKSRIWSIIEIKSLNFSDTKTYIEKRLIDNNLYFISILFTKTNYKLIYKMTKGNFRDINKLLYKTFEICSYYENSRYIKRVKNKFIEMAGLDLGFING